MKRLRKLNKENFSFIDTVSGAFKTGNELKDTINAIPGTIKLATLAAGGLLFKNKYLDSLKSSGNKPGKYVVILRENDIKGSQNEDEEY